MAIPYSEEAVYPKLEPLDTAKELTFELFADSDLEVAMKMSEAEVMGQISAREQAGDPDARAAVEQDSAERAGEVVIARGSENITDKERLRFLLAREMAHSDHVRHHFADAVATVSEEFLEGDNAADSNFYLHGLQQLINKTRSTDAGIDEEDLSSVPLFDAVLDRTASANAAEVLNEAGLNDNLREDVRASQQLMMVSLGDQDSYRESVRNTAPAISRANQYDPTKPKVTEGEDKGSLLEHPWAKNLATATAMTGLFVSGNWPGLAIFAAGKIAASSPAKKFYQSVGERREQKRSAKFDNRKERVLAAVARGVPLPAEVVDAIERNVATLPEREVRAIEAGQPSATLREEPASVLKPRESPGFWTRARAAADKIGAAGVVDGIQKGLQSKTLAQSSTLIKFGVAASALALGGTAGATEIGEVFKNLGGVINSAESGSFLDHDSLTNMREAVANGAESARDALTFEEETGSSTSVLPSLEAVDEYTAQLQEKIGDLSESMTGFGERLVDGEGDSGAQERAAEETDTGSDPGAPQDQESKLSATDSGRVTLEVQEGSNLWSTVSEALGPDATAADIARVLHNNGLSEQHLVQPGETFEVDLSDNFTPAEQSSGDTPDVALADTNSSEPSENPGAGDQPQPTTEYDKAADPQTPTEQTTPVQLSTPDLSAGAQRLLAASESASNGTVSAMSVVDASNMSQAFQQALDGAEISIHTSDSGQVMAYLNVDTLNPDAGIELYEQNALASAVESDLSRYSQELNTLEQSPSSMPSQREPEELPRAEGSQQLDQGSSSASETAVEITTTSERVSHLNPDYSALDVPPDVVQTLASGGEVPFVELIPEANQHGLGFQEQDTVSNLLVQVQDTGEIDFTPDSHALLNEMRSDPHFSNTHLLTTLAETAFPNAERLVESTSAPAEQAGESSVAPSQPEPHSEGRGDTAQHVMPVGETTPDLEERVLVSYQTGTPITAAEIGIEPPDNQVAQEFLRTAEYEVVPMDDWIDIRPTEGTQAQIDSAMNNYTDAYAVQMANQQALDTLLEARYNVDFDNSVDPQMKEESYQPQTFTNQHDPSVSQKTKGPSMGMS